MGACYYNLGDFLDSMAYYTETMCTYNFSPERNYSNVSKFFTLWVLQYELGEFQEFLDSFKGSLSLIHEHGGKNGVNTTYLMSRIYKEKNAYNSALNSFRGAHSLMESLVGKNHLDVAEILQNSGVLYTDMGEIIEKSRLLPRLLTHST